jgi:hypothetical protein
MARPKNVENMTHEERIVHFEKFREREAEKRQALLDTLPEDMMKALESLQYIAKDVGEDLQYMGEGSITVQQMHRLIDDASTVEHLFNLGWRKDND